MPTMGAFRLRGRPEPAGLQATARDGPVVAGIAEGEDATVGGDQPVAAAVGRRRDAHDGTLQVDRARRTVELGGAEGEDAAVRSHQPVAVLRRGRRRRWRSGGGR